MAQGDDIFPIPGTTRIRFLEENLGAFGVKLNLEEVADIRKIIRESESYGERYPPGHTADLFRDTPPLVQLEQNLGNWPYPASLL
jgi:diketogulonate reductase-like aldo/keto reductase